MTLGLDQCLSVWRLAESTAAQQKALGAEITMLHSSKPPALKQVDSAVVQVPEPAAMATAWNKARGDGLLAVVGRGLQVLAMQL